MNDRQGEVDEMVDVTYEQESVNDNNGDTQEQTTRNWTAEDNQAMVINHHEGSYTVPTGGVNPYLPLWEHIPDGEPRVIEDPDYPGKYRMYIYGSHDTRVLAFCGYDIPVWSASVEDPGNWRYDGIGFRSIVNGKRDVLFAPDVVEMVEDGKKVYYLYPNNQASGRNTMVAKADRPDGPYEVINWKAGTNQTQTDGVMGFDPAVFVDDDGRVYGYWGFQRSFAAELDPATMSTVKPGTQIITDMIPHCNDNSPTNDFRFFEASSLRKIEDKYLLIYSRMTKEGEYGLGASNNTLAYAYGDSPLGPWTYGGTLVDARGPVLGEYGLMTASQPSGNTHGSIIEINGQWYVFYHRAINKDIYSRQGMVSPIRVEITVDGRVVITGMQTVRDIQGNEYTGAEVTSEGFSLNGLDPYTYYSAGITSFLRNHSYVKSTYDTWHDDAPVVNNLNNSVVGYKYFNFDGQPGEGKSTQLEIYLTPKGVDGTIDIMLDSPWERMGGANIGTLHISNDAAQQRTKMIVPVPHLDGVSGKHAIYLVFRATGNQPIADLNGLQFSFSEAPWISDAFTSDLNNWSVVAGSPTADNGLSLNGDVSLVANNGAAWSGYEFISSLKLTQGTLGLRFLQSDPGNYYELRLNDGNLALVRSMNGDSSIIGTVDETFGMDEPISASIAKVGDTITIRFNGVIVMQLRDATHAAGTIGLSSYDGAQAFISDVRVWTSYEAENTPVEFHIAVDGKRITDFAMSDYDYNVFGYDHVVPIRSKTVPYVTARASDPDVRVNISQELGTTVVRFFKGDQVKTYHVNFICRDTANFEADA